MPHIVLELSDNVLEKNNLKPLLQHIHRVLAENLPTLLSSCKSRVIEHAHYLVGDGHHEQGFVHVRIGILPGRTTQHKTNIGQVVLQHITTYFEQSKQKLGVQLSLELHDLDEAYFKA
jgi:5-carboxymethyl-2-hydroxymuconate isomerase